MTELTKLEYNQIKREVISALQMLPFKYYDERSRAEFQLTTSKLSKMKDWGSRFVVGKKYNLIISQGSNAKYLVTCENYRYLDETPYLYIFETENKAQHRILKESLLSVLK
jgi:hypothetical protein